MIVHFSKPNAGPLTIPVPRQKTGGIFTQTLRLLKGNNEVPNNAWADARKLEQVKKYINNKWLTEKGSPKFGEIKKDAPEGSPEGTPVEIIPIVKSVISFYQLEADEVDEIIAETWNMDTLAEWLDKEKRDAVRLSLIKQVEKVKKYVPTDGDAEE